MPMPFEYQNASMQFNQFMVDARDYAGLATTNMAWNMVVGVLRTFRRRLPIREALRFGDVLPPVVRAIFLENWDPDQLIRAFGSPEEWLAEVRAHRSEHNFSPDNAIQAVAAALRKQVDISRFEPLLMSLPREAQHFWAVEKVQNIPTGRPTA